MNLLVFFGCLIGVLAASCTPPDGIVAINVTMMNDTLILPIGLMLLFFPVYPYYISYLANYRFVAYYSNHPVHLLCYMLQCIQMEICSCSCPRCMNHPNQSRSDYLRSLIDKIEYKAITDAFTLNNILAKKAKGLKFNGRQVCACVDEWAQANVLLPIFPNSFFGLVVQDNNPMLTISSQFIELVDIVRANLSIFSRSLIFSMHDKRIGELEKIACVPIGITQDLKLVYWDVYFQSIHKIFTSIGRLNPTFSFRIGLRELVNRFKQVHLQNGLVGPLNFTDVTLFADSHQISFPKGYADYKAILRSLPVFYAEPPKFYQIWEDWLNFLNFCRTLMRSISISSFNSPHTLKELQELCSLPLINFKNNAAFLVGKIRDVLNVYEPVNDIRG